MLRSRKYTYILFDFDGCLADTLSIWMDAYKFYYAQYGVKVTEKEIIQRSWGNWEQGPKNLGVVKNIEFINKVLERVRNERLNVKLHLGVGDTIKKLKRRDKRMAVISSSKRIQVVDPIEKLGLQDCFEVILCEEDVKNYKPHPEIIEKALIRMSGKKDEAIIVGDSSGDIKAGQAAQIDTVIFYPEINYRFYTEEQLRSLQPDYFITDFQKLLTIVH